jgi:hypothetical protein
MPDFSGVRRLAEGGGRVELLVNHGPIASGFFGVIERQVGTMNDGFLVLVVLAELGDTD